MIKSNFFRYNNISGTVSGYFDIYQGVDGFIYLVMGDVSTMLLKNQINELGIDLYSLSDFDVDDYNNAYSSL